MQPRLSPGLAAGLLIAASSYTASALLAQSQPFPFARTEPRDLFGVSRASTSFQSIQLPLDLNGDGIDDFVGGSDLGSERFDGVHVSRDGRFENLASAFPSLRLADVVVDFEGDGDLDLLAIDLGGGLVRLLNDGTGVFTAHPISIVPIQGSPALAPVTAVVGWFEGTFPSPGPSLIVQTSVGFRVLTDFFGTSSYRVGPELSLPVVPFGRTGPIGFVAAIDVNGDGILDLVDGVAQTWLGDGMQGYRPDALLGPSTVGGFGQTFPTIVTDLNGDGLDDYVWEQAFLAQPGAPLAAQAVRPDGRAIAAADLDHDGAVDLVWRRVDGSLEMLWNDGAASGLSFTLGSGLVAPVGQLLNVHAVGDFDGDGHVDLLLQGTDGFDLFVHDGQRGFTVLDPGVLPDGLAIALVGDLDGDGTADALRTDGSLLLGVPGERRFVTSATGGLSAGVGVGELGDIDGDGDLDYVDDRVWINDGTGHFADETASRLIDNGSSNLVRLADMDGDGDLDRVAIKTGVSRLFLNNGSGIFLLDLAALPNRSRDAQGGAIFDLEGDGDLDLFLIDRRVGTPEDGTLLVQDAQGVFAPLGIQAPLGTAGSWIWSESGDLDGDGDEDIVVLTDASELVSLENLGSGFLGQPSTQRFSGISATFRFQLGDLDGDGLLDLLSDRLVLNDGFGRFSDATNSLIDRASLLEPQRRPFRTPNVDLLKRAFDVDDDGDLDLLIFPEQLNLGFFSAPERVATNRLVQLSVEGLSDRGSFLNLRVDAAIKRSLGPRVATLLIAGGMAFQPLAGIGVFRLDPATVATFGSVTIPQGELSARFALPIPDVAALQGLEIWSQALITEPLGRLRLTGAVRETIR